MSAFIHVDRTELVTATGERVGFTLRRNGSWWSLLRDDGLVYADTESESEARDELARLIETIEADGGCLRKRWRGDGGVTC